MTDRLAEAITGADIWRGAELLTSNAWIHTLDDRHRDELTTAVARARTPGCQLEQIDIPSLSHVKRICADILEQIEGGLGFSVIRGIPIADYSVKDMEALLWILGAHIGTADPQDRAGNMMHNVRDAAVTLATAGNVRKYQTNEEISFHNDGSDIFMLLCVQDAKFGGKTLLVSAGAVFNEVLRTSTEAATTLQQPFYFDARDQQAMGMPRYQAIPIYSWHQNSLSVLYKRFYIESAQRFPEVPHLTSQQIEAMDLMDAACHQEGMPLAVQLAPGDALVVNNYSVLHARTAYEDHDDPERTRHLLRLWMTIPNGRPLPALFATSREFQYSYARRMKPSTGPL